MRLLALAAVVEAAKTRNEAFKSVLNLLSGLKSDIKAEADTEQVNWAKLKSWCETSVGDAGLALKKYKSEFAEAAGRQAAQAAVITKQTTALNNASTREATARDDLKASADQRTVAKSLNEAKKMELEGIISQVEGAQEKLGALQDTTEVAGLLQQSAAIKKSLMQIPNASKIPVVQDMLDLLQQPAQASSKKAYLVKSGSVLQILEDLHEEFVQKKSEVEERERMELEAYELKKQELTTLLNVAIDDVAAAKSAIADAEGLKGGAQDDKASAKRLIKSTEDFLTRTNSQCTSDAQTYATAQSDRAKEMAAIEKAVEILSGGAAGTASAHIGEAFTQASLLQISSQGTAPQQQKVAAFLKERATTLNSKILMQLAHMAAADPFGKVKGLLRDLIEKLKEEVVAESDKQGKCAEMIQENDMKTKKAQEKKDETMANLSTSESLAKSKAEQLEEAQTDLKDKQEELATGTQLRAEQKQENSKVQKESEEGEKAVMDAIDVLAEVFDASLVQVSSGTADDVTPWDAAKPNEGPKGSSSQGGGASVIDALQSLASDMNKAAAEAVATESEQDNAWSGVGGTQVELNKSIGALENDIRDLKTKVAANKDLFASSKDDLKLVEEELEGLVKIRQETLEPQCVQTGVSFEERNKARQEEIASLKQALEILEQNAA